MKVFGVCLLLVIVAIYGSSATDFTSCDDLETKATANVTSVDVEGCPNGEVCVLSNGVKKTITFKFVPSIEEAETKTFIHDVDEQTSKYEITDYQKKPCLSSGILKCPLIKNETYIYTDNFSVKTSEDVESTARFEIRNRSHKDIVCFDFAIKATAS